MKWKVYIKRYAYVYVFMVVALVVLTLGISDAVTAAVDNSPINRTTIFVIDAGHGGIDGGATSCTGVLESEINLEIALRLNDVMHLMGYETVLIRDTDISVYTEGKTIAAQKVSDLKHRVKIVNEIPGAVLVSIHQNTYPDAQYSGAQVFYNDVTESKQLASALQSAFAATVNPGSVRQIKQATGLYLMEHVKAPAVLVECGFISNPQEEANLRDVQYQKKFCCVLAATLAQNTHLETV